MTTIYRIHILFYTFLVLIISSNLSAQVKTGTAEVKTLKKAIYGGTYSLPNGGSALFFQEKD
jgi:hypothetical protein